MEVKRVAVLRGTLQGQIWMPAVTAQLPVKELLPRRGRIEAIKRIVDGAGDFQSARLTADSYIMIQHRTLTHSGRDLVTRGRIIGVTDLPSLADYVDRGALTFYEDDLRNETDA